MDRRSTDSDDDDESDDFREFATNLLYGIKLLNKHG